MANYLPGRTIAKGSLEVTGATSLDGSFDMNNITDDFTLATYNPQPKVLKFQYDFADLGGAQGAITLTDSNDGAMQTPDNAFIKRVYLEGITSATSGGSATIKVTVAGVDVIGATAFDNGEFDAEAATELTGNLPKKANAAANCIITVATADLTAGKFNVYVEYVEGD